MMVMLLLVGMMVLMVMLLLVTMMMLMVMVMVLLVGMMEAKLPVKQPAAPSFFKRTKAHHHLLQL